MEKQFNQMFPMELDIRNVGFVEEGIQSEKTIITNLRLNKDEKQQQNLI